ncbi:hypothetical protein WA026_023716 [Henosepilachna vigintioctopunctata]|uniref:Uncharacterized protein n=1 Tax=Henosepilachna vigintioctopunctata TaxID=420089 RepID=A0AAW1VIE3_9CUCU
MRWCSSSRCFRFQQLKSYHKTVQKPADITLILIELKGVQNRSREIKYGSVLGSFPLIYTTTYRPISSVSEHVEFSFEKAVGKRQYIAVKTRLRYYKHAKTRWSSCDASLATQDGCKVKPSTI